MLEQEEADSLFWVLRSGESYSFFSIQNKANENADSHFIFWIFNLIQNVAYLYITSRYITQL